jgi:hypothetical protein
MTNEEILMKKKLADGPNRRDWTWVCRVALGGTFCAEQCYVIGFDKDEKKVKMVNARDNYINGIIDEEFAYHYPIRVIIGVRMSKRQCWQGSTKNTIY